MVQPRRRVSYVIPLPIDPVPRLQLPPHGVSRLGSIGPILIPSQSPDGTPDGSQNPPRYPRHRLGIASLAIDTSTQLSGHSTPQGILYTGGRDGLVISWDLGIPMKKRKIDTVDDDAESTGMRRPDGRWEIMTGWGDDVIDEEEEGDDRPISDGDILGDVTGGISRRRRAIRSRDSLPYENQWETDLDTFRPNNPTQFRQSAQTHSDWVNDILLCNYNQTLVSASSDGTVKAWSPHSPNNPDPVIIGSHSDYVRCLAQCREQNWVASGSFDRTIKLWDLSREQSSTVDPIMTLNPPDATAPKSSVYAIAADPFGHTIASGSPERVIRMWDPRSGKRTGKLVGHTDNIRAILISEDSRYLLTGSADASIKLWSLASQRCLHTFAYHTDSVWSLFSAHPSLETFYSGDRSGLVCKVDVEGCSDVSEGECIVLCQESADCGMPSTEGINKIVALDDNLLWTATGNSSIKRWLVPQRRAARIFLLTDADGEHPATRSESPGHYSYKRANSGDIPSEVSTRPPSSLGPRMSLGPSLQSLSSDQWLPRDREDAKTLYGIPFESLVKLTSPNSSFTPYTSIRGRDPEVATLYSAASVMSVPAVRSPLHTSFRPSYPSGMQSSRTEDTIHPVHTARAKYEDRELATDAIPLHAAPDDVVDGDNGLVRSILLNDRIHALTVDTSGEVAVWDVVRGVCRGRYPAEEVAAASRRGSTAGSNGGGGFDRSPREALEAVRERIEGEAVIAPWSAVDTKTGVLTVHLTERCFESEIYADEVGFSHDRQFNDESRLNIGKWVLRNIFLGFIREEQRIRRNRDNSRGPDMPPNIRRGTAPNRIEYGAGTLQRRSSTSSTSSRRTTKSVTNSTVIASTSMIPAISPAVPTSSRTSPLLTPMIPLYTMSKDAGNVLPSIPQSPIMANSNDTTPMPRRLRSGTLESHKVASPSATPRDGDYFSFKTRQQSSGGAPPTPDDFSGWGGPGSTSKPPDPGAQTPSTPGGLIGRLKSFGKSKRPADATPPPGTIPAERPIAPMDLVTPRPSATKTPLQILLSSPLMPPTSAEAPLHPLHPTMTVIISEETSPGWDTVYRGTIASISLDVTTLEESMPLWLLEYLWMNKVPPIPVNKISFVLLPWPNKDPDGEQLPELLNTTQSKLTAARFLRVRKLVLHVHDKLDKMLMITGADASARSSVDANRPASRPRVDDIFEIICNDVILPLDMSLAAVRQYVWRQSSELTMYYRRRLSLQSYGH